MKENISMARFYTYKNKKENKEYWGFQAYLGTDPYTGKRIRVSRRKDYQNRPFRTKKQAELEVSRLKLQFNQEGYQKPTFETFEEAYKEWYERRYKQSVKPATASKTESLFRRLILPQIGNRRIEKITKRHCEGIIQNWFDEGRQDYKLLKNYVSNVLDYAVQVDIIKQNPMKKAYVPKQPKRIKPITPYYTKEELNEFLKCAYTYSSGEKWGAYFHFLAFTGCRKSEGLALVWKDFDFEKKTVSINKTLTYAKGSEGKEVIFQSDSPKNGENRTITLDDYTIEVMKKWKKEQAKYYLKLGFNTLKPNQLVFPNESNEWIQPSATNIIMEKIIAQNRLKKVSPHGLRHSHCSLLFEAGVGIKEVQTRLGHRDIKNTLNIYAHVTQDKQLETAENFLKFMKN